MSNWQIVYYCACKASEARLDDTSSEYVCLTCGGIVNAPAPVITPEEEESPWGEQVEVERESNDYY